MADSVLLAENYSRSAGGQWDKRLEWDPRGVPDGDQVHVTLANNGSSALELGLNGKQYTVKEPKATGNDWTLSNGALVFDSNPEKAPRIEYSGPKTLTLATALKLKVDTDLDVSNEDRTVRLLGAVSGESLTKRGPGLLLIEAPFDARLSLGGGITGIAPAASFSSVLHIGADSKLFALNGDLNIPHNLFIPYQNITLDIIDNPDPNESTRYNITLGGSKSGYGIINQRSHGDLIFAGKDHFAGTINTYDGYGRVVLNGDTGANIQMKGGEIAGQGETRGDLTARNGATISPGDKDSVGTLSFGNVDLDPSTILNFKLGSVNNSDLINVNGNLRLAGNLDINALFGFWEGTYTLFNYKGKLTYNKGDLSIRSISDDSYDPSEFYVQTAYSGKVNLLLPENYYYSRSASGQWDKRLEWDPRGVPDSDQVHVTLANNGSNVLELDLNNKQYTIKELKVTGNDWTLSNGTLVFNSNAGESPRIEYSGSKTNGSEASTCTRLRLRCL